MFRTFSAGRRFCLRSVSITGLQLARGARASSTSMTRSVLPIAATASLRAVSMCPGYHEMGIG